MRTKLLFAVALHLALVGGFPAQAEDASSAPLLLILDASGSMWGQIEGENKIVIARRVLNGLVDELPETSELGLVVYGHRREGDCEDIETVVPMGSLDKAGLKKIVGELNPRGKTPITDSVKQAFEVVRAGGEAATVILVSDGLETCGGDPCAAVRAAKDQGIEFIMHVVGFDVAGEDVSQLECAAQAGGGLFMSAENADGLSAALDAAVAMPADFPPGRLVVRAVADGELHDVSVAVMDATTGRHVAGSRTYRSPETNPRSIPLPDGKFDVKVQAMGMKGDIVRRFEIEIADGSAVEKEVDFSTGEIVIGVTRNGELSDATFNVMVAGTRQEAARGRTYTSAKHNPAVVKITAGNYDVEIGSVEIKGAKRQSLGRVTVEPRGRAELSHDFKSGTLRVGAVREGQLADATVNVVNIETGKPVGQGRTYTSEKSNPKTFTLEPGRYRVTVRVVKPKGLPDQKLEVTVEAGKTVEQMADFGS